MKLHSVVLNCAGARKNARVVALVVPVVAQQMILILLQMIATGISARLAKLRTFWQIARFIVFSQHVVV